MHSSRCRYSRRFWFLLSELPLVLRVCTFHPPPVSVRGVAPSPLHSFFCLQGFWCLTAAKVADLVAWGTGMVGSPAASGISYVTISAVTGEGNSGVKTGSCGRLYSARCCKALPLHRGQVEGQSGKQSTLAAGGQGPRPQCNCCLLPQTLLWLGGLDCMYVPPPLLLPVLWGFQAWGNMIFFLS